MGWMERNQDAIAKNVRARLAHPDARSPASIAVAAAGGFEIAQGLAERGDFLEQRIAALEERLRVAEEKGIAYQGVWQRAQTYGRGAVVTHKGSAWVALAAETQSEPGATSGWQLMVRAGKDAK